MGLFKKIYEGQKKIIRKAQNNAVKKPVRAIEKGVKHLEKEIREELEKEFNKKYNHVIHHCYDFIVDEIISEYDGYIVEVKKNEDSFIAHLVAAFLIKYKAKSIELLRTKIRNKVMKRLEK